MKIVVAPHIPLVVSGSKENPQFESLDLLGLPNNVTLLVPENWDELLVASSGIVSDYELFSMLIELPVECIIPEKKAVYIKINPDILEDCNEEVKDTAKQQLYALWKYKSSRRIYAGTSHPADKFKVLSDKTAVDVLHFRPGKEQRLRLIIESFEPELWQLKHFHEGRVDGGKEVAPFSAYSKRDDKYAKSLLRQAYEDYDGDVDDRTYLYTYDAKYKTFVEFRPDRGNKYHGRDIDIEYAKRKAPDIVRRYNQ